MLERAGSVARHRYISFEWAVAVASAFAFTGFVAAAGLPALRHDWTSIAGRADFVSAALATLAWDPNGVGAPRPYPANYLLVIANILVAMIFGSRAALAAFAFGMSAITLWGASELASLSTSRSVVRAAMLLFALFNPWVYTEVVAGHLAMIGVYGALMGLIAECLKPKPRPIVAALCMCAIVSQTQFFVIAFVIALYLAVWKRTFSALATAVVVALPSIVGIALNFGQISGIRYTLNWQVSQSLTPYEALNLIGYFAQYTLPVSRFTVLATLSVLALALIGACRSRRRGFVLGFVLCGACAWLWATGTRGPIAPVYTFAILHLPALEIFRELYDLLAFLAIAYVALATMGADSHPILARLSLLPGVVLVAVWFVAPPSRFWLNLYDLPRAAIATNQNTRIAFLPDLQPLSYLGRGSGIDPDAYARPNNVTTLNGAPSVFPAGVALREYALHGTTAAIAALGVSQVVDRPWLTTDVGSLAQELALAPSAGQNRAAHSAVIRSSPELELVDGFPIALTPPDIGSAAVYFGDAAGTSGDGIPTSWAAIAPPVVVAPPGRELRASSGWVDASQAFLAQPELGQGLGGAMTTSASAVLPLGSEPEALVWVRGRLLSGGGAPIATDTQGYRWVRLPPGTTAARCDGECVVAEQADALPAIAGYSHQTAPSAVSFQSIVPWLAVGTLAPNAAPSYLRYAVGFDPHWIAIVHGTIVPHVRLESSLNGWIAPPHSIPVGFVFVEFVAAIQMLCEVIGTLWTIALVVRLVRT